MSIKQPIAIAGCTGYLGLHLVQECLRRKMDLKAIARNPEKLSFPGLSSDQIITAEVTKPTSLQNQLDGIQTIISTVGITRQKDGLTYMDVDYQANLNLLNEAKSAGVKKFVYVSAINGREMRDLKIMEAKERFVDALIASGLEYLIIRPNGFFSDMKDFLDMAKGGRIYLFGDGEYKLNPIHGADLAKFILDSLNESNTVLPIGGPDILTQNEIGQLALGAFQKHPKISHLPDWIRRFTIRSLRVFTSSKTYGPFEFFLTMMAQDNIAPRCGEHHLKSFFEEIVEQ